jgi:hypothetical protein
MVKREGIILDKSILALSISIQIGKLLKEIAIIIGYLLIGLISLVARKARAEGKPKSIQLAQWSKQKTIILIRTTNEVGRSKAIEVGQISKGLLILAGRKLKM